MNLSSWIGRHARSRPHAVAIAEGAQPYATWADLAARVAAVAGGLRSVHGLLPGDRVAIVMRNRPEYLVAKFAAWHAGLVAVPVNARLHREEIAYILEDSGSKVVLTDDEHADLDPLVGGVARGDGHLGRLEGRRVVRRPDRACHASPCGPGRARRASGRSG